MDSIGAQRKILSATDAPILGENRYFLLHQTHDCDNLLPQPVAAQLSEPPAEELERIVFGG